MLCQSGTLPTCAEILIDIYNKMKQKLEALKKAKESVSSFLTLNFHLVYIYTYGLQRTQVLLTIFSDHYSISL